MRKNRTAAQPAAAPETHRKKTFWERLGLFFVSAFASVLFAGVFIVLALVLR